MYITIEMHLRTLYARFEEKAKNGYEVCEARIKMTGISLKVTCFDTRSLRIF
tara:strand:- start:701 stop:856 length:156 start_codon:yes stop_codon:yes gene_type:complete